jgi:hypothetical protein
MLAISVFLSVLSGSEGSRVSFGHALQVRLISEILRLEERLNLRVVVSWRMLSLYSPQLV